MSKNKHSKNRYQLRYTGEPHKDGSYDIIRTARSHRGLFHLFYLKDSDPAYSGENYAIIDKTTNQPVERPEKPKRVSPKSDFMEPLDIVQGLLQIVQSRYLFSHPNESAAFLIKAGLQVLYGLEHDEDKAARIAMDSIEKGVSLGKITAQGIKKFGDNYVKG